MSNRNSFQGLQFRIMETLEKQPNQAPLTALEIAERLHTTEYRNEMKDNVVYKVTQAVHSMKNTGKIVTADARDREGRLTYQLPSRLKFPVPNSGTPANPVLTPEHAAKIKTVEPKPEKPEKIEPQKQLVHQVAAKVPAEPEKPTQRTGKTHASYVPGIQDKIIALLDEAAHPLTGHDIAMALGHLYGDAYKGDVARLKMMFAGHLHNLSKKVRKIHSRKSTVKYAKYEFFTRKTGAEPHPLAHKKDAPARITAAEAAKALKQAAKRSAPAPVEPPAPAPAPPNQQARGKVVVETKAPAPVSTGGFRPRKEPDRTEVLTTRVSGTLYDTVQRLASTVGMTVSEFCHQAIQYAVDHAEVE
jgi:hypothetical protein